MKRSKSGYLYLSVFLLVFSKSLTGQESTKIVVTPASFEIKKDPYEHFYKSSIFESFTDNSFISVKDASLKAFIYRNENSYSIFFSKDEITKTDLVTSTIISKSESISGFKGFGFLGVPISNEGVIEKKIIESTAASVHQIKREIRQINGKKIIGYEFKATQSDWWPQDKNFLNVAPAALINDQNNRKYLVVARPQQSIEQRLQLLKNIKKEQKIPPLFIEFEQKLTPGKKELIGQLSNGEKENLKINFYSINRENTFFYAQNDNKNFSLSDALKDINENSKASLTVIKTFSTKTAHKAAKSPQIDLVLLLQNEPYERLDRQQSINLNEYKTDSFRQNAPIFRVSPKDIMELELFFNPTKKQLKHVEVKRHAIDDAIAVPVSITQQQYKDLNTRVLKNYLALRDGDVLTQNDFDNIFGQLLLNKAKADVALFEKKAEIVPVYGPMNMAFALSRLNRNGRLVNIHISGLQIKNIVNLIKNGVLRSLNIFGLDKTNKKFNYKNIDNRERFSLVLTEKALKELYRASLYSGFIDYYSDRAPFVEGIYGKITSLYFIGGPKTLNREELAKEINEALNQLPNKPFISNILRQYLMDLPPSLEKNLLKEPTPRRHAVRFDIRYFDIGFSKNISNSVYRNYQENKRLPISRGGVPIYAHFLVLSSMKLIYDAPSLISQLGLSVKFFQTNMNKKPEKDKVKFSLDFRLPFERSYFQNSNFVMSPIFKNAFETQLAPLFLSDQSYAYWLKKKVLPRKKKLDSLLGVNVKFNKLNFNFDVGGRLAIDLNSKSIKEGIDYGPGLQFFGSWNLFGPLALSTEIDSYYLFSPQGLSIKDKVALGIEGTAWLRLARIYDFSISLMSDFLMASLQESPNKYALSTIFGLTVSYGRLFRLLN